MNRTLTRPLAAALLALLAGCGARTHLTDSHGRSMRAVFASQAVDPEAGNRPHKLPGLDAQEAAIVVKNYRRSLATKNSTQNEDQGMVIMAPAAQHQQPYLPPPSVPQERR